METGPQRHVAPGNERGHAGIRQDKGTEGAGWVGGILGRRSRSGGKYFQAEEMKLAGGTRRGRAARVEEGVGGFR